MSPTASGIVVAASIVLAAWSQMARHNTRSRGRCSRVSTSRQPTRGRSGDAGSGGGTRALEGGGRGADLDGEVVRGASASSCMTEFHCRERG